MIDIRKIVVVLLIAILLSVFVFSTIEAVYPSPEWDDYCENNPRVMPVKMDDSCEVLPVPQEEMDSCKGYIDYRYDSNGCAASYFCNTCQEEFQAVQDTHQQVVFYVSAFLALVAIFVGLYIPAKKNKINEWVGTGLLLGGAFVLIFGTIEGFGSLHRFVKPIVMLAELVLVIFLAYKKLGDK